MADPAAFAEKGSGTIAMPKADSTARRVIAEKSGCMCRICSVGTVKLKKLPTPSNPLSVAVQLSCFKDRETETPPVSI